MHVNRKFCRNAFAMTTLVIMASTVWAADKPNMVIIWGDDIGQANLSVFTRGVMGYETPNIDRIANEGVLFTDYYAEQSCTAGRAAFLTGQSVFRTGQSKVGMPGAKQGLSAEDPTIATLLKEQGYATAQFGKNHQGDRNEFLPTVHGFDEFYGNLYHLNAEEEPELPDYPKDPAFRQKYGPRGVLHCIATDKVDKTEDPRFGIVGKQRCEDTGPLTKKRMETIDGDIARRSRDWIRKQHEADKPFFVWVNFTHMHFRTHVPDDVLGLSGPMQSFYHDAMVKHDQQVGSILDLIDELGIAEDTIVMYSTDNGPHKNTWPDAGTSPFRNEKNSGWEGAFRVPAMVRWTGQIEPGRVSNDIMSHLDWVPTLAAVAGEPEVGRKLLKGYRANGNQYKVHLDGFDFLPYLTGKTDKGPRDRYFYFSDDGDLLGLRFNNWKVHFMVQDQAGTLEIWQREFRGLRIPFIFNLRTDPYEQATITSNTYWDWYIDHAFILYPLQDVVGAFLGTFKDYPPRQEAASFTIGEALEMLSAPHSSQ